MTSWDPKKARKNAKKHEFDSSNGFTFEKAEEIYYSDAVIGEAYDAVMSAEAGEDRYVALFDLRLGIEGLGEIVYTLDEEGDGNGIHIISARKFDKKEVKDYENYIRKRYQL